MFETQKKTVVIVCDDKTKEYGEYLKNLIAECDDVEDSVVGIPDGEVTAIIIDPKKYSSNPESLNSDQHVIFIGKSKEADLVSPNVKWVFSKFGIKYGWLGRSAVLFVDKKATLSNDDYREFLQLCSKLKENLENIREKKSASGAVVGGVAITVISSVLFGIIGGIASSVAQIINSKSKKKADILKQRYTFAVFHLYLESLSDFLGF